MQQSLSHLSAPPPDTVAPLTSPPPLPDFQMAPVFYESPPSSPAWFLSFSTLPLIPVEALVCLQRVAKNGLVCTQPGSFQELGTLVP